MLILTLQTDVYSQNWVMTCAVISNLLFSKESFFELVIQFLTFIRGIIWIPLNLTRAIVEFSEPEDNEYVNLDSFESFEKKYVEVSFIRFLQKLDYFSKTYGNVFYNGMLPKRE